MTLPLPASSSIVITVADAQHELMRPLLVAGRVYHVLPLRTPASSSASSAAPIPPTFGGGGSFSGADGGCCAYRAGTPPTVVYRADRASFDELIVSTHMFADHMPFNYVDCLDTLAMVLPEY